MDWPGARQRILAVTMAVTSLLVLSIAFRVYNWRDRSIDVAVAGVCAAVAIRAWVRRGPGD